MNKKELIYSKLLELSPDSGIDAQTLSSMVSMTRANVSHELNTLCKEGKVYKSTGRPVLFFAADKNMAAKESSLDIFVKNNISLTKAVEQAKAAILYPPKGLPSLLLGDTGVGKSMFASLMHDYSIEMEVRKEGSPFIVFNCADYCNNPQLLTSQLFGVKKGAYTGAEADRSGLIEKADGGMLFLDEVHRLPPEGQEILFTYLDTGSFRRLGDYETRKSDVLIISATTEDPDSALLRTFTRRIPVMIKIPSLKERSLEERLYLIKNFFKQESVRLNKDIHVSLNSMRALFSYDCTNNIGQLKSDVQLICARAYSEYLTNIKFDVRVTSSTLPLYVKEGLYKEKEHRVLWNKIMGEEIEFFKFSPKSVESPEQAESSDSSVYSIIESKLEKLKSQGIADIAIENILEKDISMYFNKHMGGISEEINKKSLRSIIEEDVLECIDTVIYCISTELKINISSNMYTALALHINTLVKRVSSNKAITNPQLNKIKELYPKEFEVALKVKGIIEKFCRHEIVEDEAAYLTIFLLPEEQLNSSNKKKVKVVLIAHGDSTATSMAAVANKLLGESYVIGINAPLEVNPSKILDELRDLVRQDKGADSYLLLVDMGSLTTFADTIEKEFQVEIKVIPLASTLHVLEAARKAILGLSLDDIYKEVLSVNSYFEANRTLMEPEKDEKKVAIITACLTGEGGSVAIKSFLENNLNYDKEIFEVIALNCLDKSLFHKSITRIQEEKEILFIVSSFPVDTDIRQYNMYDVVSMKVMNELQQQIDAKTTLIKMPVILKENIPNLDGTELYGDVMHTVENLQTKLAVTLKNENLIGLILHLSFMVSKLKGGDSSIDFPDKEPFIAQNLNLYNTIKDNLIFLCSKYSINISNNEVCYVMNFFKHQ